MIGDFRAGEYIDPSGDKVTVRLGRDGRWKYSRSAASGVGSVATGLTADLWGGLQPMVRR